MKKWHGIPIWILILGVGVGGYFAYHWYKNRTPSTAATNSNLIRPQPLAGGDNNTPNTDSYFPPPLAPPVNPPVVAPVTPSPPGWVVVPPGPPGTLSPPLIYKGPISLPTKLR
jgi:hypothetical protein